MKHPPDNRALRHGRYRVVSGAPTQSTTSEEEQAALDEALELLALLPDPDDEPPEAVALVSRPSTDGEYAWRDTRNWYGMGSWAHDWGDPCRVTPASRG